MSDGYTEAMRGQQIEKEYSKRLEFIRLASLEDLCNFYSIEKQSDPVLFFHKTKATQLKRDYSHWVHKIEWELIIRIPGAYSWTESFSNVSLEEVCTRCAAYLKWAETDLGNQAISNYLDHK